MMKNPIIRNGSRPRLPAEQDDRTSEAGSSCTSGGKSVSDPVAVKALGQAMETAAAEPRNNRSEE